MIERLMNGLRKSKRHGHHPIELSLDWEWMAP